MSKQDIIARILSDAEREADEIVAQAKENAEEIRAEADRRARSLETETEAEISERARRISEGREAAARLDSAKILLAEKRRVLDEIYARSLKSLIGLSEHDALALYEKLLRTYSEAGETVMLAERFPYAEKVRALSVFKARGLTLSKERAPIAGGFLLKGETCDKDVSFEALLSADREEHQAEIAARIFK